MTEEKTDKQKFDERVELMAEAIYDKLPFNQLYSSKPKWMNGGNSLKQDECRTYARAALSVISPEITNLEQLFLEWKTRAEFVEANMEACMSVLISSVDKHGPILIPNEVIESSQPCRIVCEKQEDGLLVSYENIDEPTEQTKAAGKRMQSFRKAIKELDDPISEFREKGWTVAIHNDYRLNGKCCTFWLLTHPNGTWIKGEGQNDAEAFKQLHENLAELESKKAL